MIKRSYLMEIQLPSTANNGVLRSFQVHHSRNSSSKDFNTCSRCSRFASPCESCEYVERIQRHHETYVNIVTPCYTCFCDPALRQCSNAFRTNLRLECIPKPPGFRPKEQLLRESGGTAFELDRLTKASMDHQEMAGCTSEYLTELVSQPFDRKGSWQ